MSPNTNARRVTASDKTARSAETEEAILEAARAIVAENGSAGLSMRLVAERVGLSATAIYRYFDGKDDLLQRIVRMGYRRFGEYLNDAMERHPSGSLERLFALGDAYVRFAFENREYFRVLYSIQVRNPRDLEEFPGGGGYDLLRGCVEDAMRAGTLRDGNPDIVAHYLWTCVHGLVTLALACNLESSRDCPVGLPHSAVELFRSFAPFLADGLRAGSNDEPPAPIVWWQPELEKQT